MSIHYVILGCLNQEKPLQNYLWKSNKSIQSSKMKSVVWYVTQVFIYMCSYYARSMTHATYI
jgi:ABC-type uncharacterized transport system auxiliary subunit